MRNITKRGEYSFRVKIFCNGHFKTATFDKLADARIWRDRQKASSELDVEKKDIQRARITQREAKLFTVGKALDKYVEEITPLKKGADVEKTRIGKAKRTKLAALSFYLATPDDVLEFMEEIGGTDNNRRKYASLICHLYTIAKTKWRMQVNNPVAGEIELPSNGKPRDRRLKDGEYDLFMKNLKGVVREMFIFSIETAARRGELLKLTWDKVNLKSKTVMLLDTKNGEDRAVPLSTTAIAVLKGLKRPDQIEVGYVFNITASQLRDQWEAARKAAGCPDLRWHDMRHEACSRLFEKGLNMMEAASVTGHKTLTMLQRYTHLNPTNIAKKLG